MKRITPTLEQQRFIDAYNRSILLQACVGTGKTFALAHRVARAIQGGITPERILCVTFTNRAAREMRERIGLYCPESSHKVVVRTFHALCAWILRQEARRLGIPQDFEIIDEDDAAEIISHLGLDLKLGLKPAQVGELIQRLKLAFFCPEETVPYDDPARLAEAGEAYQKELRAMRALDFADLIVHAGKGICGRGPIQEKWARRFDLVQVDEMQDTHLNEYRIIASLACRSQNLTLCGDFDQTIYEWRGSRPEEVLEAYAREFPDYCRMEFTLNHRATRVLVEAAQGVVRHYSRTHLRPAPGVEEGDRVVIYGAESEAAEARWIAKRVQYLLDLGIPHEQIGVLCRTNGRASTVSDALAMLRIPHMTVETYEFFRRQEVKDCLAYLRLLLNPDDRISLRRVLQRPPWGIGAKTIERIEAHEAIGLWLTDFVNREVLEDRDPFIRLLDALATGTVVVFDCETTGLDPAADDVIEIAALKIQRGRPVDTFHRYLRSRKPVGQSEHIHGISDGFLRTQGEDPREVLKSFKEFTGQGILLGHNVSFDLAMLESAGARYGVPFARDARFDTLNLARRFIAADTYTLENLAAALDLAHRPSHQATADVAATWDLLQYLSPLMAREVATRMALIQTLGQAFWPLAEQVARWRRLMREVRPVDLLKDILKTGGLLTYYAKEPKRLQNLRELLENLAEFDDPALDPVTALRSFLSFAALARNVDRVDSKGRVMVVSVHQSKGLEFEEVFLAGLSTGEFPHYYSVRDNREMEERRLFYVGITRAKRRLYVTYHLERKGWRTEASPYLAFIPDDVVRREV